MMEEVWKEVKGFEGLYWISNYGRIRNKNKILRQHYNKKYDKMSKDKPYLFVALSKNNKPHHKYVHRLVAEHFIDNPNNYPEVNHIDGNKENNNYINLEWCTREQNIQHSFHQLNRLANNSKTVIQYDLNMNEVARYRSAGEASRATGICYNDIKKCARGQQRYAKGYKWKYA